MKVIKVPKPILLVNPETDKETGVSRSFADYLKCLPLSDLRWVSTYDHLKLRQSIREKIVGDKEVVELTQDEWRALMDCVRSPRLAYQADPQTVGQLIPFMDAIVNAEDSNVTANT